MKSALEQWLTSASNTTGVLEDCLERAGRACPLGATHCSGRIEELQAEALALRNKIIVLSIELEQAFHGQQSEQERTGEKG